MMIQRSRIFIAQGVNRSLINKMTISPRERINVDNIIAITALKYPYMWPYEINDGILPSLKKLDGYLIDFADYLRHHKNHHVVLSEYANMMDDLGNDLKIVYGSSLEIEWIKQSIHSFHKNRNHKITFIHRDYNHEGYYEYFLNDEIISYDDLLKLFSISK